MPRTIAVSPRRALIRRPLNASTASDPIVKILVVTMRRVTTVLAVALLMLAAQSNPAQAAAGYPEEAVKAVFLYRFAGYVTWPASTANEPEFTIAVLGANNVAEQLKALLPEHPIQGKSGRVATIQALSEVGDAQMIYVGAGYTGKLGALVAALKDRPILIVSDQPGALEEGSMVNFLVEQEHVRFEISTFTAKRAGLVIGSSLLAVAERVKTGGLRGSPLCPPFGASERLCPLQLASLANRLRNREGG